MSDFRYFRSVPGAAVLRYGTRSYIGCVRTMTGFVWTDEVIAIPALECRRFVREYRRALADKALIELRPDEALRLRAAHDRAQQAQFAETQRALDVGEENAGTSESDASTLDAPDT